MEKYFIKYTRGGTAHSNIDQLGGNIEVGATIYEISDSEDKIFIAHITKRILVYIVIHIIELAIQFVSKKSSGYMSSSLLEVSNYIIILKEWLEGNSENIDSLKKIDSLKNFNALDITNDIMHIDSIVNDCIDIIKGIRKVHISDISFYAIACRNSKERNEASYKHSLFIINFLKSHQSLFYIVD